MIVSLQASVAVRTTNAPAPKDPTILPSSAMGISSFGSEILSPAVVGLEKVLNHDEGFEFDR